MRKRVIKLAVPNPQVAEYTLISARCIFISTSCISISAICRNEVAELTSGHMIPVGFRGLGASAAGYTNIDEHHEPVWGCSSPIEYPALLHSVTSLSL